MMCGSEMSVVGALSTTTEGTVACTGSSTVAAGGGVGSRSGS